MKCNISNVIILMYILCIFSTVSINIASAGMDAISYSIKFDPIDKIDKIQTRYGILTVKNVLQSPGDTIYLNGDSIYTDNENNHIYLLNKLFTLENDDIALLYENTGGNSDNLRLISITKNSFNISKPLRIYSKNRIVKQNNNLLLFNFGTPDDMSRRPENYTYNNRILKLLKSNP